MKCSKCGSNINEGEKFCKQCGNQIMISQDNNSDLNNNIKSRKNKNNSLQVIIMVLLIAILLVVSIILISKPNNNEKKDNKIEEIKEKDTEEKDEEINIKDNNEKETKDDDEITLDDNIITIYITKEDDFINTYEMHKYKFDSDKLEYVLNEEKLELSDNEKVIATYNCKNKAYCKALENDNENYVLILDSIRGIYLYNIKDKKAIYYDVFENLSGYADPTLVSDGKKAYGIIYYTYSSDNEEERQPVYYSFNDKKDLFKLDKKYELNYMISYLQKGYLIATNETTNEESLIDIKTGKTFKTIKDITGKNDYYFYDYIEDEVLAVQDTEGKINVLDKEFKPLFKTYYDYISLYNDKYYAYNYEAKEYYVYDIKTAKEEKISLQYQIYDIIENYIIVSKNNKIVILNDKEKEITEVDKASEYLAGVSEYYKGHDGKPSGIYLIFEKYDIEKSTCDGREYHFDSTTNKLTKYTFSDCNGGYAKPVLYLYPTKTTEVTVNFERENMLTTTYPKFNKEWKVTAHSNGDLYDKNGNYYYALYWEEAKNHKVDFSEGFYVTKDNAITFLEEKLTYIGLNAKERNEFIMYWLPIIEKNEKNLIYFELTEERDKYNKIKISPKPDSLLRMAIHIKKVDKKVNIKEQKLTQFKRSGFTAVEWGGVRY